MSRITGGLTTTLSGTVGTGATLVLAANPQRQYLSIQCVHATQTLQFTLDSGVTTPVINGAGNYLAALGGSATYDTFIPTGGVTLIGSGAGTTYTIVYA